MIRKELVIAKYNRNTDWTNQLNKDIKVTIYNKNKNELQSGEILIDPNVGRCVHTFMFHIIKNYYCLSDLTYFSQDYPFDHIPNYIDIINNEFLLENSTFKSGDGYYINSNPNIKYTTTWMECYKDGTPQHSINLLDIERAWKSIFQKTNIPYNYVYKKIPSRNEIVFNNKPFLFKFVSGGHYVLTKEKIIQKDISFYTRIINYIESYPKQAPYEVERILNYIFDKNFI